MVFTGKSGNPSNRVRAARAHALLCSVAALILLPSCTNNLLNLAQNAASINGGNPLAGLGDGGNNSSGLQLSSVQFDTFNPTTTLDLLGDGTGAMGNVCQDQPSGGTPGGSTCTCTYSYILPDGTQVGPIQVDTSYHESDLLRCPYSSNIPNTVQYVTVSIHLTGPDLNSNSVTFKIGGSGASGFDASNPLSYTQVQRYQCRDIIKVPYVWDPSAFYDPFVSEDPQYTYPMNFYTTNMGGTLASFASAAFTTPQIVGSWNCPALPNDTSAGMDLTLYSVTADSAGSKSIFPPNGAFDRATFYLANGAFSVFKVPVNSYVYPSVLTTPPQPQTPGQGGAPAAPQGIPSIGYAAEPIPLAGGGETCPDSSVVIPPGYHWAKLWLFRKQLPQRSYPASNKLATFGSAGLACNTPKWTTAPVPAPPKDYPFNDCSGSSDWNNLDPTTHLASRFSLTTGQCFTASPGATTDPTTHLQLPGFEAYAVGTDRWFPVGKDNVNGCTAATSATDLSHACSATTQHVPWDQGNLSIMPIDTSSRFDYLFVVSPPSVNRQDMAPTASSSIHSIYTPVRFMSPNDCKALDPDQPTFPGDCSPSRMLTYGITVADPGTGGGQRSSTDPNEPGEFPMCVLQPD